MQCVELECSNIVDEEFRMTLRKSADCQVKPNYADLYHKLFDEAFISSEIVFSPSDTTYTNLTYDNEEAVIEKDFVGLRIHEPVIQNGEQDVRYSTTLSTW